MKKSDFYLRPLEEKDLDVVLVLRNSDRVRFNMFETDIIPLENHLKWFKSLQGNPHSHAWLLEYRGQLVGVVTMKLRDEKEDNWIWGCYLSEQKIIPKAGTIMGFLALE